MLEIAPVLVIITSDSEALKWCKKMPVSICFSDRKLYNAAYVKNCGIKWSTADTLTFLDCDRIISPNPLEKLKQGSYVTHCINDFEFGGYTTGTGGNITAWKKDCISIGGYDESFGDLYGREDTDFEIRLQRKGINRIITRSKFQGIEHPKHFRTKYTEANSPEESLVLTSAKLQKNIDENLVVANQGKEIGLGSELVQEVS